MRSRAGVLALLLALAPRGVTHASDHVDGPIATGEPVSDITDLYAFPTAGRPGHLTVVLDVYPLVSGRGHFSDRVRYEVLIRRARTRGSGLSAGFHTLGEYRVSCSFETPHGWLSTHRVTCQSTAGTTVTAAVDEIRPVEPSSGLRVFAGRRSDPFFLDTEWFTSVSEQGVLLEPKGNNGLEHMNVLSIVLEVDVAAELPAAAGSLLAVAAQTTTTDAESGPARRLDRVGRPEITNVGMVARERAELKPRYNTEDPFDVAADALPAYRERLRENVDWYDGTDGVRQWTEAERDALVELLLDDFLVVDTSPDCTGAGFFELEAALLRDEPSTSCGGRTLDDDVMDTLYTLLVNRGLGPEIHDGVSRATQPPAASFPYLAAPNDGLVDSLRSLAVRVATALQSSGRVWWGGALGVLALALAAIGLVVLSVLGVRVVGARRRAAELPPQTRARALGLGAASLGAASVCLGISSALLGIWGALPLWLPGVLLLGTVIALVRHVHWRRRAPSA
ncbi:MAG: DUF4331 family protein [Myxococcales bacterium]|nr:DUF4331 family protein [Myxococcales bacterium]